MAAVGNNRHKTRKPTLWYKTKLNLKQEKDARRRMKETNSIKKFGHSLNEQSLVSMSSFPWNNNTHLLLDLSQLNFFIKCFGTHSYMKTQCLQTNRTQHC